MLVVKSNHPGGGGYRKCTDRMEERLMSLDDAPLLLCYTPLPLKFSNADSPQ